MGYMFDGFRLHFEDHVGGKKLQKSMSKLNEKTDAILEAIWGSDWRGRRHGVRPRGGGGVVGDEDLKVPHAVHLPEAEGGGSNGASPVPPASERRLWRIDFGSWKFLTRKLWFGGSFLDEKVIGRVFGRSGEALGRSLGGF